MSLAEEVFPFTSNHFIKIHFVTMLPSLLSGSNYLGLFCLQLDTQVPMTTSIFPLEMHYIVYLFIYLLNFGCADPCCHTQASST